VAKAGPRRIEKYGDRFKATAVKLSKLPGVSVQDVAAALDIHPFMLSLWRRQVRERVIVARAAVSADVRALNSAAQADAPASAVLCGAHQAREAGCGR